MSNLNPLQRHIAATNACTPQQNVGLGMPIDGIRDFDQLKRLVEMGVEAGHWTVERTPIGRFAIRLTDDGAALLNESKT